MRPLLAHKAVGKVRLDYNSNPVTTSAWTVVIASTPAPCVAIEVYDSSGSTMKISIGAAGHEDANEVPYYIIPGASEKLIPLEIGKGRRLSIRAVDQNTGASPNGGQLIINLFG